MGISRPHTAMTPRTRSLLLAVSLLAAGCAGMSETQCRGANWYELGEREALIYGLRPQIEQHAYACAKFGVEASEKDYIAGWNVGQGERIRRAAGEGCCSPH
jgi:hypothetical protein